MGEAFISFVTARVDDPALVADLEAAHVRFTGTVGEHLATALLGGSCLRWCSSDCGRS